MNVITIANVYTSGRRITQLLNTSGNPVHLAQQLRVILEDRNKLGELVGALESLDTALRVLGFEDLQFTPNVRTRNPEVYERD